MLVKKTGLRGSLARENQQRRIHPCGVARKRWQATALQMSFLRGAAQIKASPKQEPAVFPVITPCRCFQESAEAGDRVDRLLRTPDELCPSVHDPLPRVSPILQRVPREKRRASLPS